MAKKYSGVDVQSWKACTNTGKPLTLPDGKPATSFKGYADANAYAKTHGGYAVRV